MQSHTLLQYMEEVLVKVLQQRNYLYTFALGNNFVTGLPHFNGFTHSTPGMLGIGYFYAFSPFPRSD